MNITFHEIDEGFWNKKHNYTKYIEYNMNSMVKQLYDEFNVHYNGDDPMKHRIFFLQNNDQVVGYKYFYFNPETKNANFFSTSVDELFRKRGYARQMIEKSIEFLIKEGIQNIKVCLIKDKLTQKHLLKNLFEELKLKYCEINIEIFPNPR